MADKLSLNLEQLEVTTFATAIYSDIADRPVDGGISWPDVCTCIDICAPTEDIYCSGGCQPETTIIEY
jgi:hypothetical protein